MKRHDHEFHHSNESTTQLTLRLLTPALPNLTHQPIGMSTALPVKKALSGLLRDPRNNTCADCKAQSHPRWASWSLGVFICIKCAGIHRSLGTHISKVKSVDLDTWKEEHLTQLVRLQNNEIANRYYEARLPDSMKTAITDGNRLQNFIRNKYENRKWVGTADHVTATEPVTNSSSESIVSEPEFVAKPAAAAAGGGGSRSSSTHSSLLDLQLSAAPRRDDRRRLDVGGRPDLKKSILSLYSRPASTSSVSLPQAAPPANPPANPPATASLDDNELFKNVWSN